MKNGELSNFTRSHISSDRVRSGYEIKAGGLEPLPEILRFELNAATKVEFAY